MITIKEKDLNVHLVLKQVQKLALQEPNQVHHKSKGIQETLMKVMEKQRQRDKMS